MRVLFPIISLASFVQADLEALQARYDVESVDCGTWRGYLKLLWLSTSADTLFLWFGSLRFIPLAVIFKLRRKKIVIITGGYDVANEPEMSYGNMRPGMTRVLGRFLFRLADRVVCFSAAAAMEAAANAGVCKERLRLAYLGFTAPASDLTGKPKERLILSVGNITASTLKRKGIAEIVQAARQLPDETFVIAGRADQDVQQYLNSECGPNVLLAGYVSDAGLQDLFARASIYVQPSRHEGFGSAVAEAMLWNCVPVVSQSGSLPEVVGDSGVLIESIAVDDLVDALQRTLDAPPTFQESPRARVCRLYSKERRQQALYDILDQLCGKSTISHSDPNLNSDLERRAA